MIDLPGVRSDGVELTVDGGRLTLAATQHETASPGRLLHGEWSRVRFERTIELPATADPSGVTAELKNGVLDEGDTVPDAALIDSLSARTAGRYGTLNLDLQRNQRLGGGWGVLMTASGQLASRNLDSYQKFVLGGVQGLRGYPSGEAVGDEGWLASGELYYAANPAFIPSVFLGAGGVRLNETPFLPTDNRRTLHSYGAALRGSWRTMDWTLSIAGHGAERAQSEPDRAVRVWVQAGWAF